MGILAASEELENYLRIIVIIVIWLEIYVEVETDCVKMDERMKNSVDILSVHLLHLFLINFEF